MAIHMPGPAHRVASITVAFNPDPTRLQAQIEALRGQVERILIVDNNSQPAVSTVLGADPLVEIIALDDNRGVASGFNIGVAAAREWRAQSVLLLDHDSVPAPGMVAALVAALERSADEAGAPSIAAVGPRVNDVRDRHEYPFIQLGWIHNRHLRCADATGGLIACDFLISAGSLIPMASFESVGPFDETLFIDSVDLEWCCRARDRGLTLYGVCDARLDHWLGDHRRTVLGAVTLVVHSPQRIYYMTRNRLLLYRRSYMPLKWKLKDLLRFLAKFAATVLLIRPRRENARMTAWAIRDALAGRGGKLGPHGLRTP
jgi:rhamnosyltransferase